jgi:glucose-6-phosphate isomerase
MLNKYSNNLTINQLDNSPAYYNSVLLSSIPEESIPFYYTSKSGDRLDTISNLFYKTPSKWWIIAKANNLANGSIAVPAGLSLFIPNV